MIDVLGASDDASRYGQTAIESGLHEKTTTMAYAAKVARGLVLDDRIWRRRTAARRRAASRNSNNLRRSLASSFFALFGF